MSSLRGDVGEDKERGERARDRAGDGESLERNAMSCWWQCWEVAGLKSCSDLSFGPVLLDHRLLDSLLATRLLHRARIEAGQQLILNGPEVTVIECHDRGGNVL